MATDKKRLTISLGQEEEKAVEKYRHENGLPSASSAIVELLQKGIDETVQEMIESGETVVVDARKNLLLEIFDSLDDEDKAFLYRFGRFLRSQEKYK